MFCNYTELYKQLFLVTLGKRLAWVSPIRRAPIKNKLFSSTTSARALTDIDCFQMSTKNFHKQKSTLNGSITLLLSESNENLIEILPRSNSPSLGTKYIEVSETCSHVVHDMTSRILNQK